jgi:hypothetical protein
MELTKENHQKAKEFKEVEKIREQKVINKALIGKLLEINEGKQKVSRNSVFESQTAKAS